MRDPVDRIGRDVRNALEGPPLSADRTQRQRMRLIQEIASEGERRQMRSWRTRVTAAVALAGVAVVASVFIASELSPLGVSSGEVTRFAIDGKWIGREGAWLTTTTTEKILGFRDGTRVVMRRASRGRVAELQERQTRVSLETGQIQATVRRRPEYRWLFEAGPYEVEVVGTVLRVGWEPEVERLRVHVLKGRVRVRDGAGGHVWTLQAGEWLDASPQGARVGAVGAAATAHDEQTESPLVQNESAVQPESGADEPRSSAGEVEGRGRHRQEKQSQGQVPWSELAARGQYREAYEAARAHGLAELRETLGPWDLLGLADAVRLAGQAEAAKELLTGLRKRFPSHPAAADALFRLGRIAIDFEGDPHRAVHWFRAFLERSPTGPLSGQAQGRLMEALVRAERFHEARYVAQRYLKEHPDGSYARAARDVLNRSQVEMIR